jgi:hypothetical protein
MMKTCRIAMLALALASALPASAEPTCDPSRGQFRSYNECYVYSGHQNCEWDAFLECYVIHRPTDPGACDMTLHRFEDPWTCQRYYPEAGCTFDIVSRCFVPRTEEERCSRSASRWVSRERCEREEGRECYLDSGCWSPVPRRI